MIAGPDSIWWSEKNRPGLNGPGRGQMTQAVENIIRIHAELMISGNAVDRNSRSRDNRSPSGNA